MELVNDNTMIDVFYTQIDTITIDNTYQFYSDIKNIW